MAKTKGEVLNVRKQSDLISAKKIFIDSESYNDDILIAYFRLLVDICNQFADSELRRDILSMRLRISIKELKEACYRLKYEEDKRIVIMCYGLDGNLSLDFDEIAEKMGTYRERVRQRHFRGLRQIKRKIESAVA